MLQNICIHGVKSTENSQRNKNATIRTVAKSEEEINQINASSDQKGRHRAYTSNIDSFLVKKTRFSGRGGDLKAEIEK